MTTMHYEDRGVLGRLDWGAVLAAVVVGLGVTLLLVSLGIAVGALATQEVGEAGMVTTAVGLWTILSALAGAFVGTYVGGRFARSSASGSVVYHGATAWSLVTVLGVWFGATGVVGLLGSALAQIELAPAPDAAPALPGIPEQAIGWGGWALFLGLLVTLAVSVAGWWVGARSRPAAFEADEQPVRREREAVTTTRR